MSLGKRCHYLQQRRVEWSYNLWDRLIPTWTIQPPTDTIQSIAAKHIKNLSPGDIVTFIGEDAFNKVYSVSDSYLMRVTLPVDPWYKTASEVATLTYLRRHTSVLVPRVIAYSADTDSGLGFEWILMEKMAGEPLDNYIMSNSMDMEVKEELTREIARWAHELQRPRFVMIGSLYFSQDILKKGLGEIGVDALPVEHDIEFCVGPIVNPTWFVGNRAFLPSNRGPFKDETEWFQSQLEFNMLAAKNPIPGSEKDDGETDRLLAVYRHFLTILPNVFAEKNLSLSSGRGDPPYVIHNSNISTKSLLIDPKASVLAGWVDWECVSTAPRWATHNPPGFLDNNLDRESLTNGVPEYIKKEGGEDEFTIERRDTILNMQLRKIWNAVLEIDESIEKDEAERLKFQEAVLEVDVHGCDWGESWIADTEV